MKQIAETTLSELKKSLLENSVVVVRGNTEESYIEAASDIGRLVPMEENLDSGDKNGNMFTNIRYEKSLCKQSYSFSNTRQPLHTDGSYEKFAPAISFFFCRTTASVGGETIFMPNDLLIDNMPSSLLDRLSEINVKHFKGSDYKIRPILIFKNNRPSWNWNFFRAEKNEATNQLVIEFKEFLDHLEQCHVATTVKLNRGDAVFFWDEDQLHGRNAFMGDRWLVKGGIDCVREV